MEDRPLVFLSWPIERVVLAMRWESLALAIGLSFIDRSTEGIFVGTFALAGGIAAYFLAVTLVPIFSRLPGRPILVIALDTLVATLAVYLNGGYHSSFFILYVFVLISVALCFNVVPSLLFANLSAFLYVLTCLINPAGLSAPLATYFLGTKLALMIMVAAITTLLLEQLRLEQRQTAQEKELAEAQASFVSMVSHELQTPVTCIKSSVEMLLAMETDAPDENRQELLHTVSEHSSRLESLIAGLLQVAKLEANQVVLTRQPTDLVPLLKRTAQAFAPLLAQKEQTLTLELMDGVPRVWVDRARTDQIISNLLSNANKFTPAGGHIVLRMQQEDNQVQMAVSDDGPGIPQEEQGRVFEKFYVGRGKRSGAGVGLGLYIARWLVELHDGQIEVESLPGSGSTFTVTLPIDEGERYSDEVVGG